MARSRFDGFDARERLALELAEALTVAPASVRYADAPQLVPDEMLVRLREQFSEPAIVELVATIGLWNALRALPSRDGLRPGHGRAAG